LRTYGENRTHQRQAGCCRKLNLLCITKECDINHYPHHLGDYLKDTARGFAGVDIDAIHRNQKYVERVKEPKV